MAFLQLVVVFRLDKALPAFDSKHAVNVDLRVGIGHAPKMPLLTELENILCVSPTTMPPLTGLAEEPSAQDVVRGNVSDRHLMDVTVRGLAEVGCVGLPAELVPVAGEDALRARPLERDAESADAAEDVHEAQFALWPRAVHAVGNGVFAEHVRWGRRVT